MLNRDQMIDELTNSMYDAMQQDSYYMDSVIRNGFKGFNNYSDDELLQEWKDYISD